MKYEITLINVTNEFTYMFDDICTIHEVEKGKLLICENRPRVRVDILCDISVWGIDAFLETFVLHSFDCSNV